jgi:hypothetical protein
MIPIIGLIILSFLFTVPLLWSDLVSFEGVLSADATLVIFIILALLALIFAILLITKLIYTFCYQNEITVEK